MTRISEGPHGWVEDFLRKAASAGLSAEHLKMLNSDPTLLREWIASLPAPEQIVIPTTTSSVIPAKRVSIKIAFKGKGRTMYSLLRMKFVFLDEVAQVSAYELVEARNFGGKALAETERVLSEYGLQLRETDSDPMLLIPTGWDYGHRVYRHRIKDVSLWQLFPLSSFDDYPVDSGPDEETLGDFMGMNDGERSKILTDTGIAKVKHFIAAYGL